MTIAIKDFFYDERLVGSTGAGAQRIDFLQRTVEVPFYIQNLSVRNFNSAAGNCDLVLVRGGKELYLDNIILAVANKTYVFDFNGYVQPPDFIRLYFTGTNANDLIYAVLHGLNCVFR